MSDKVFLDTNILAYCFDSSAPEKQRRSREILGNAEWVTSWQVVQEFANLALHKFAVPMKPLDLADYVRLALWPHCTVLPSQELYGAALKIQIQTQYRFYDCLVVASAIASGARLLVTEDLQDGRSIGMLTISNPFVKP